MKDRELIYEQGSSYIRNVKHDLSHLNIGKSEIIDLFIVEYRRLMKQCLDELWNMKYYYNNNKSFIQLSNYNIKQKLSGYLYPQTFNCIKQYKGSLTARAISSILTQLGGILKGLINSYIATGNKYTKPCLDKINPEISSKHIKFTDNFNETSKFQVYIILSALIKEQTKIVIPIHLNKMDVKYRDDLKGSLKGSISLKRDDISIRYEIKPLYSAKRGEFISKDRVIGADMGINKILTLSDGQMTSNTNSHNKSFNDCILELNRTKKGSCNNRRKLIQKDNFIKEVINKLDFSSIDVLQLESNKGIKANTNNSNHYWATMVITNKIITKTQEKQVALYSVPSYYKSQRCFKCGFTHKLNRHKEDFKCRNCSHNIDADLNASLNNSIILPFDDSLWIACKENKRNGFFWLLNGSFNI